MTGRVVETTVTYLAMQARPAQFPPMPSAPRLALMKAEKIPLHFYRYLYSAVGGSWLWVERLALTDEELSKKFMPLGSMSSCFTPTARRPATTSSTAAIR